MKESPCIHCETRSCEDLYNGDHECFELVQTYLRLGIDQGLQVIRALTGQRLDNQHDLDWGSDERD